jgi:hypothetical protein
MNVILFDSANGDASEHAYARDQLLKFLATAEVHEPLAIFALHTDLKLLHDFTTDARRFMQPWPRINRQRHFRRVTVSNPGPPLSPAVVTSTPAREISKLH